MRAAAPAGRIESQPCDFASLDSVRELAARALAAYPRIDVLVNNAGTVFADRTVTEDGFEATFAVDHLGGFLLTELVKDAPGRERTGPDRVHLVRLPLRGSMDLDDPGFEHGGYPDHARLRRSKLANVLYARHLARDLEAARRDRQRPASRLGGHRHLGPGTVVRPAGPGRRQAPGDGLAPTEGGKTITYLATSPEVEGRPAATTTRTG